MSDGQLAESGQIRRVMLKAQGSPLKASRALRTDNRRVVSHRAHPGSQRGRRRDPEGETAAVVGLGSEGRVDRRDLRYFSHEAMATVFEVHAEHPDPRYAAQAARAAFDLADRLEGELSRFVANSDIGRINSLKAGEFTRVTASTLECLVIARHVFDLTGGAFDVSIGTGLASLEFEQADCLVRATRDDVQIDLGGIGKGYAVDRMAEVLEEWGLDRALVHGGFSSVLALEPPTGAVGWPLTLSDPAVPSTVLVRLSARQMALGASGIRKGDHIVDPRTGAPADARRAAWVAVPRMESEASQAPVGEGSRVAAGTITDALATAFMLLGPEEIEALCERSPGLEAWLLPDAAGSETAGGLIHFGG
jgi:thiamine biosynthesis lipoprotein